MRQPGGRLGEQLRDWSGGSYGTFAWPGMRNGYRGRSSKVTSAAYPPNTAGWSR
jgi:hypothetical protein